MNLFNLVKTLFGGLLFLITFILVASTTLSVSISIVKDLPPALDFFFAVGCLAFSGMSASWITKKYFEL